MNLVLEKRIVQVAIEPCTKRFVCIFPRHGVAELQLCAFLDFHRKPRGQVNFDNLPVITRYANLFLRVNEGFQGTSADELAAGQRLRLFTLYLANHTPYWQIIQIQLVPVVVAHCVVKLVSVLLA